MSFDRLAPFYRAMEFLLAGSVLQRARTAFLDEAAKAKNALLVGEGPGRYLVELLRVNPYVSVTCVDSSRQMLQVADRHRRARGFASRHVRFTHAEWLDGYSDDACYDLVASHFFLDCFRAEELVPVVAGMRRACSPSGILVLSDFCEASKGWQRLRSRLVLRLAYVFFRIVTRLSASSLTPPQRFLEAVGFRRRARRVSNHGLVYAELWHVDRTLGPRGVDVSP